MNITTPEQYQLMVTEIQRNPILTKSLRNSYRNDILKQEWDSLAIKINALGPPTRTAVGWNQRWEYLRRKVRKKLLALEWDKLSELDVSVAILCNMFQSTTHNKSSEYQMQIIPQVNGDDYSIDIQMPKTDIMNKDEEVKLKQMSEHDIEMPDTSGTEVKKLTRDEILEKQLRAQEGILMEMKSLNDTLKRNELIKRHMYELEIENLNLRKRQAERDEQLYEEKTKQNQLDTEIKMQNLSCFEKHFTVLKDY